MAEQGGLRIQVCGRIALTVDGRRREGELRGRQGRALFVYLVVNRRRPTDRWELIDALWPAGPPQAPDAALSTLLSNLRNVLGADRVEGRAEPRLVLPDDAFVDLEAAYEAIHRAESAIARKAWVEAWGPARVALHTANRRFMAGYDSPWIDEVRRGLEDVRLRALECVAATGVGLGGTELAATERSGRALVQAASFRESGYRYLMEALEARGNVAEALRTYDELRRLLMDELGIPPGPEIRAVYERLVARAPAQGS